MKHDQNNLNSIVSLKQNKTKNKTKNKGKRKQV